MRLSRLELFGFKSFLHRTVFQFNEGVTSIVGPNGCGKSNVVDAVVWALGERGTKSLRIKDMGDVIFHGSNGKRPVNIAEVAIEFTDGEVETAVKRRIYRDGSNEYLLNGKVVRLKDVLDFFLGTGIGMNSYAVIEQGKIEYFVQMKPQERKVVIEETSGVTRFEEKKRDAMTRLEEVGVNLERVEDIYREVVKSFEKAEQEWQRWREYKVLADRLLEADKWILVDGHVRLTKRMGKIEERGADLQKDTERKGEELTGLKAEEETKEKEFALMDTTIRQLEVDLKGQEKDMESRLLEIDYLKEEGERLEKEKAILVRQQGDLESRIAKCRDEAKELTEKRTGEESQLKAEEEGEARIRGLSEGLKAELGGYERKIEEERVTLFVSMSKLTEIRNRLAEIERLKIERTKREERRQAELERLREKLEGLEIKYETVKEILEKERDEKARLSSAEQEASKEKETTLALLQQKRVKIEQLKSGKRGKEEFIRQMRSLQGVREENPLNRNKLIDVVRVDEEAETALERFFFKEMEYYVLMEEDMGAVAETVGKHEGNYIFFPGRGIFRRNETHIHMEVKWAPTIADALARIEGGEEGIFINNTACVDSRGFILREREGGRVDLKSYRERVKAEKELKEISASLDMEAASLPDLEKTYGKCETGVREAKAQREAREKKIHGLERDSVALETELRTVRERIYDLETKVEIFGEVDDASTEDLSLELATYTEQKAKIEGGMASLRQKVEAAKKAHDEMLSQWHQATLAIERKRNLIKTLGEDAARKESLALSLEEEKLRALEKMKEADAQSASRATKSASLEKSYGDLKRVWEEQTRRCEELKIVSGNIHMERHALREKAAHLEKEIERIRARREGTEKEILVLMEKRGAIDERLATTYGIEEPDSLTVPGGIDFEEEREGITREIGEIGEVNFRAEKEYTELKERVAFLEQQKEDLRNAADSLKKTISKIDGVTKEIFFETFETVNTAFKRFTEMLFKGGKGYLAFNQDTAGIDLYVQPPGKKVARMEQLSGGEKALISLSFLLSLIDTRPSPFVLMDEIDAPLDDANLMSLMEIIKDMSAKTQIVFVTHNRITMESSNTIYGVTMEEEGISKTISVRL